MGKDICSGSSPWKCSVKEAGVALELSRKRLLPVGPGSIGVNIVALWDSIKSGNLTPDDVRRIYQVNGPPPQE